MNKTILFLLTLTFISTNIFSQKNITITTTPADAEIFAKYTTGEKKIGEKGVAKLILAKKNINDNYCKKGRVCRCRKSI